MKYRPIAIIAIIILSLISNISCKKEDMRAFSGDYTYNTSGKLLLISDSDAMPISIPNQIGQMHIIKADKNNEAIIVKQSILGKVLTGTATTDGDVITFDPITTTETIFLGAQFGYATITSTAHGKIYGRNTIIVNEVYSGSFAGMGAIINKKGIIYGDSIITILRRNEK